MSDLAAWLRAVLGSEPVGVEPLLGGMSSVVVACDLADGRRVVVREITDREWLDREPDLIRREATALRLVEPVATPTPRLLAADPSAQRLAMSFEPGSLLVDEQAVSTSVPLFASALAEIHRIPAGGAALPPWRRWGPARPEAPTWAHRPELWGELIEHLGPMSAPGWAAPGPPVLLHRDPHPLNLLWSPGRARPVVVDWVNACWGHPFADLAHARWNLSMLAGLDAADDLLDHHPDGDDYDHRWDLVNVLGFLPGPMGTSGWHAVGRTDLVAEVVIERTEEFIASALHRSRGSGGARG